MAVFSILIQYLPILYLFGGTLQVLGFVPNTEPHLNVWDFIAKVLLFHSLHVGLTFFLLVEQKKWWLWQQHFFSSWTNRLFCVAFISLGPLLYSAQSLLNHSAYAGTLAVVSISFAVWHVNMQHLGLSLQIEQTSRSSLMQASCWLERRLVWVIIIGYLCGLQMSIGQSAEARLQNTNLILLAGLLCALVLVLILRTVREGNSRRAVFQLRYLLFPLGLFSHLALVGWNSVHGLEYLFLYLKISQKDGGDLRPKKPIFENQWQIGVVGTALIFTFVSSFLYAWSAIVPHVSLTSLSWVWHFVIVFFHGFGFLHFFLDANIFRMKNAKSRQFIGDSLSRIRI